MTSDSPSQPHAGQDTVPYAWLFDSLTRAAANGPWWRRWWIATVELAQSSWRSGFATLSETSRSPQRRWFTVLAAGFTALALSMTGVIASVQENWTPARVGSALKFDDPQPPPPEEPVDAPVERPAASPSPSEEPSPADDRVADSDDRGEEPVATRKRAKRDRRSTSDAPSSRRSQRKDDDTARAQEAEPASQEESRPVTAEEGAPAPQPANAPKPAPATPGSRLGAGARLGAGDLLQSPNGRYSLVMQSDGNLVLYRNGDRAMWSAGTAGHPGAVLVNQTDGNVVVYGGGRALWSTRTAGTSGAVLVMQDDGNVVVYAGGGSVWASGTAG